jgi:phosphoglucomutase
MPVSPLAGKPAPAEVLIDVDRLVAAYYDRRPDPANPREQVAFGTSGHRGAPEDGAFNEAHILAITQAICEHRISLGITGPLFLGADTHAVSRPALRTALEVLAANGVQTRVSAEDEYTPTPALSRAILTFNDGRRDGLADGIIITPSHNPPRDGGFKYNPPHGGPADNDVTDGAQARANQLLRAGTEVRRLPYAAARLAATTHEYDFRSPYIGDLAGAIDVEAIARAGVKIGADPMGGASVPDWPLIAPR